MRASSDTVKDPHQTVSKSYFKRLLKFILSLVIVHLGSLEVQTLFATLGPRGPERALFSD